MANGGTGATSLTANAILLGNGTGTVATASLTSRQVLIGSAGAPVAATLTGGNSVSVTPGAGSITLNTVQDIRTSASPSFAGLTISGVAPSELLKTNGSGTIVAATGADLTATLGYTPVNKAGDSMSGTLFLTR